MTHTEVQPISENVTETRRKLIYGLNDKPPLVNTLFVAIQHVSVIFVPSVTPTILMDYAFLALLSRLFWAVSYT